jgi:nucleoside recognition membrane protein YjiH
MISPKSNIICLISQLHLCLLQYLDALKYFASFLMYLSSTTCQILSKTFNSPFANDNNLLIRISSQYFAHHELNHFHSSFLAWAHPLPPSALYFFLSSIIFIYFFLQNNDKTKNSEISFNKLSDSFSNLKKLGWLALYLE